MTPEISQVNMRAAAEETNNQNAFLSEKQITDKLCVYYGFRMAHQTNIGN